MLVGRDNLEENEEVIAAAILNFLEIDGRCAVALSLASSFHSGSYRPDPRLARSGLSKRAT